MEQFHELIKTALDGCKKAEALATCHQKRPCFKKIDSLCARLKQDLVKTDNVMSNINSQGLAWAVKDFIFVFTRIMNAWIIIKGYVHNKPEGLTSIQRELCPNFLDAFGRWHDTTHELVQSIIKSFINLNKLAKQQRGGCNIFTKVEETISPGKGNPNVNQTLHDSLDDIEEAESSLKLSDGAYIRAGIYPNVIGPPPGLPEKPQFTPCNKQQDHDQMPKTTFDTSPVSSNRPEMHDHAAAPNNPKSKASGNESDTDRLIRKTSLACINWVLEEVRVIEEGQYFYCINFTKNYFPDFHLIGSTMMDLRTVYKKHESGLYLMMADLLDDLQQILDTCKRYVEVSLAFELWNPKNPIPDPCTESQRQEMENFPKIQTFIAKMELLLSNIRKESPMEDRKKMESTMPPKGDAIRCFECNSAEDSTCSHDNPPDSMSVDCNDHKDGNKYTFCRKIVQIIEFPVNNLPPDNRVIRGCGWDESSYKGRCYQRSGFGGRQEVCACYDDNCNGASSLSVTFGVLLFGAVAFLIRA
uniref:Bromo domain-containing protein n=1 Tax=Anopheles epiroticus TaxID=199890 RepID=A0A182PMQ3_9DIPT